MRSFRSRFAPLLLALGLALPLSFAAPKDAAASVSFAVAYDEMVSDADMVAIVTPVDQRSVWEDNRIVTYTHLKVEEAVAGQSATGSEVWVKTLGGSVGKIGQLVDGEPVFVQGKSSLVFARSLRPNTFTVVARAQGQFPVLVETTTKRKSVIRNGNCGMLLPRVQPVQSQAGPVSPEVQARARAAAPPVVTAVDALHGRSLEDVTRDIVVQWKRLHK